VSNSGLIFSRRKIFIQGRQFQRESVQTAELVRDLNGSYSDCPSALRAAMPKRWHRSHDLHALLLPGRRVPNLAFHRESCFVSFMLGTLQRTGLQEKPYAYYLSSVVLWFFVCAVIEQDRVEDDYYEHLSPCCEFSLHSVHRKYSTSPKTALQNTINAN
jgi:hypothetical protein